MVTIQTASVVFFLDKNHKMQGMDCRMDVVNSCSILPLKITRKGINFVHRRSLIRKKLAV